MVALRGRLARDQCAVARPGGRAQIDLPAMLAPDIPRCVNILLGRAALAGARIEYDQRANRRIGKVQHGAEYNIAGGWGLGDGRPDSIPTPIPHPPSPAPKALIGS